jgi:hypothetical protein
MTIITRFAIDEPLFSAHEYRRLVNDPINGIAQLGVNISVPSHLTTCISIASANLFNFYSIILHRFATVFNFALFRVILIIIETFLLRYALLFTFLFHVDLFVLFLSI